MKNINKSTLTLLKFVFMCIILERFSYPYPFLLVVAFHIILMHFFLFKLKTNLKRILQYKSNIINAREYRRGVHQRRIQRHWQQDEEKHNTIRVGHHYAQTIPKNVNKTCALIQTTVGKDEPNAIFFCCCCGSCNGPHNTELET